MRIKGFILLLSSLLFISEAEPLKVEKIHFWQILCFQLFVRKHAKWMPLFMNPYANMLFPTNCAYPMRFRTLEMFSIFQNL